MRVRGAAPRLSLGHRPTESSRLLARGLARGSDEALEARDRYFERRGLDGAIGRDQLARERPKLCATAARASDAGHRDGLSELLVEIAKQRPGAAVAHPQLFGGLRERPTSPDRFEKRDLPGPDRAPRADVDAHSHLDERLRPHPTRLPPRRAGCTAPPIGVA